MKMHRRTYVAITMLTVLSGCITIDDPKNYQPSGSLSDTGRVFIYRTAPGQAGAWMDWVIDGHWNGQIRPDHSYCLDTFAGPHIIRVGVGEKKLEFRLEKDQQVFIRFDFDTSLFGKGIYPVMVDRPVAQKELRNIGLDPDHAPCMREKDRTLQN